MMDSYWTKRSEIKLYVRRVHVAEKFDELLPRYLGFVQGVVTVISKKLARKVLKLMKKLAKEDKSGENEDKDEDDEREPRGLKSSFTSAVSSWLRSSMSCCRVTWVSCKGS